MNEFEWMETMNGNKWMMNEKNEWLETMSECANNERMNGKSPNWDNEWKQWNQEWKAVRSLQNAFMSMNEWRIVDTLPQANWAYRHKVCHGAIQFFFLFWNLLWQAVGFLSSIVVIIIVVVIRVIAWTVEMTSCLSNRNDKLVPEQ